MPCSAEAATGRLFTEIRTKRSLSYGSYSNVNANLGGGTVVASAQTKNESAAEVAGIILAELEKIATAPLDTAEVGNRQTLLVGRFQRGFETSAGFNSVIASALSRGITADEALAYAQRIEASGGPAATAAMARMLAPERVSLIVVGDFGQVPPAASQASAEPCRDPGRQARPGDGVGKQGALKLTAAAT